jgi:signal transduction histidine kinase
MRGGPDKPEPIAAESAQFVSAASLRDRTDWFNRMRWGAGLGVIALSLMGRWVAHLPLPVLPISIVAGVLLLVNAGYVLRNHRLPPVSFAAELRTVKIQMVIDLFLLSVLLSLSGSLQNPFHFIYIIHVIIAGLLLKGREIYQITFCAALFFTLAVVGETAGLLHHTVLFSDEVSYDWAFVTAGLLSFWLVLFSCAYIAAGIMRHNRAIKDELVERQQALAEAAQAKIDFFRFVSHEIKTPIVTAQSAVETVLHVDGDGLSQRTRDMLERTVRRLQQALGIVKDLADLSRTRLHAEQGAAEVSLNRVIGDCLDLQAPRIAERQLTLRTNLPAEDVVLRVDPDMIEKIAGNLISNAVRYNRDGGELEVSLVDLGPTVRLTVRDTGIGIAPEDRERIFQEFFRTAAAREVSRIGTGLGLPIVKTFVELLGGTIEIDGAPGVGSTFIVTLGKP